MCGALRLSKENKLPMIMKGWDRCAKPKIFNKETELSHDHVLRKVEPGLGNLKDLTKKQNF